MQSTLSFPSVEFFQISVYVLPNTIAFLCECHSSTLTLRTLSKNIWSRDRKWSHWAVQISKSTKTGNHELLVIKFTGWLLRMRSQGLEKAEKGTPLGGS